MLTDKQIVSVIWHFKVEDKLSWKACAGILQQPDINITITPEELKKLFQNYFKETVGIKPYTKCPICGNELLPRGGYNYFIGCSGYPQCKFIATPQNPYSKKKTTKSSEK